MGYVIRRNGLYVETFDRGHAEWTHRASRALLWTNLSRVLDVAELIRGCEVIDPSIDAAFRGIRILTKFQIQS